jgi:hypothetical protein
MASNLTYDNVVYTTASMTRQFNCALNTSKQIDKVIHDAALEPFTVEVNNSSKNVNIQCNSGSFIKVVKPSLLTLSTGFSLTVQNVICEFTALPPGLDLNGLLLNEQYKVKLRYTSQPLDIQANVTVTCHSSTRLLQIQSSGLINDLQAAVWFTEFVIKTIFEKKASEVKADIENFNNAIFNVARPTHIPIPKLSCSCCNKQFKGKIPLKCSMCGNPFHVGCTSQRRRISNFICKNCSTTTIRDHPETRNTRKRARVNYVYDAEDSDFSLEHENEVGNEHIDTPDPPPLPFHGSALTAPIFKTNHSTTSSDLHPDSQPPRAAADPPNYLRLDFHPADTLSSAQMTPFVPMPVGLFSSASSSNDALSGSMPIESSTPSVPSTHLSLDFQPDGSTSAPPSQSATVTLVTSNTSPLSSTQITPFVPMHVGHPSSVPVGPSTIAADSASMSIESVTPTAPQERIDPGNGHPPPRKEKASKKKSPVPVSPKSFQIEQTRVELGIVRTRLKQTENSLKEANERIEILSARNKLFESKRINDAYENLMNKKDDDKTETPMNITSQDKPSTLESLVQLEIVKYLKSNSSSSSASDPHPFESLIMTRLEILSSETISLKHCINQLKYSLDIQSKSSSPDICQPQSSSPVPSIPRPPSYPPPPLHPHPFPTPIVSSPSFPPPPVPPPTSIPPTQVKPPSRVSVPSAGKKSNTLKCYICRDSPKEFLSQKKFDHHMNNIHFNPPPPPPPPSRHLETRPQPQSKTVSQPHVRPRDHPQPQSAPSKSRVQPFPRHPRHPRIFSRIFESKHSQMHVKSKKDSKQVEIANLIDLDISVDLPHPLIPTQEEQLLSLEESVRDLDSEELSDTFGNEVNHLNY